MHRLLAAALTCVAAAGLAVGAGLGIVAALDATPEQPNVPLVHFHSSPDEVPALRGSATPTPSPGGTAEGTGGTAEGAGPSDEPSAGGSPGSAAPGD